MKLKEIGYVLSKDYWGKELIPETINAVIECCFNKLGLDAVTCGPFLTNDQSKKVIEKCGFKYVKTSEYYAKQLQTTFTDMKYILLKENFK